MSANRNVFRFHNAYTRSAEKTRQRSEQMSDVNQCDGYEHPVIPAARLQSEMQNRLGNHQSLHTAEPIAVDGGP